MRVLKWLSVVCVFFLTNGLLAQSEPVTWSFEVEKINEDEYEIVATADIDRGWSVYSQHLEEGGPVPTSIELYEKVEAVGEATEAGGKKEAYDELFGMHVVKYTRKARFRQRVKVDQTANKVEGHVTYMTCDENSCLPPANVNFSLALER